MKKTASELRKNERVQALCGKNAVPGNRTSRRVKNFSLRVECAADWPRRVVKLENLNQELLQKKLYEKMTPVNIYTGEFHVDKGYEEQFKSIAQEHGFRATEVMEC